MVVMRKRAIALFVTLIFVMSILSPGYFSFLTTKGHAQTQNTPTILKFDFENGNQGWTGKGLSTTVATVYNVAYEGNYSLKVSGRNASWDGAVVDLTDKLSANVSYTVSLFVRHSDQKPQRFSVYAYVKDSASEK